MIALMAVALLLSFNALLFAWLAYGRFVPWSMPRSSGEGRVR